MNVNFGHSLGGGPGFMFSLISTLFPFIFLAVLGIIIYTLVRNGARYRQNAKAPQQTYYATVVAKRMEVTHHTNHQLHNHGEPHALPATTSSSRTHYYITLEFDGGDRREFLDVKRLYGLVVEGDTGYALLQGEWIVGFERMPAE